jgi:hypothetical protein
MKSFKKYLMESAPPSSEAEEWIVANKDKFKKEYGDDWESVLYATAWKMFGDKITEDSAPATSSTGPGIAMRPTVLGRPAYRIPHAAYVKLMSGKEKGKRWKEIIDDVELTSELKKRLYAGKDTVLQCEQYPEASIFLTMKR